MDFEISPAISPVNVHEKIGRSHRVIERGVEVLELRLGPAGDQSYLVPRSRRVRVGFNFLEIPVVKFGRPDFCRAPSILNGGDPDFCEHRTPPAHRNGSKPLDFGLSLHVRFANPDRQPRLPMSKRLRKFSDEKDDLILAHASDRLQPTTVCGAGNAKV